MRKTRLLAGMAASVLAAAAMALPVSATVAPGGNYNVPATDGSVTEATITKYLIMDNEANAPAVTMTYTLTAGEAAASTEADTFNVYAGILDNIEMDGTVGDSATISFDSSSTKAEATAVGLIDSFDAASQDYVTAGFDIDFANVEFPEPGIYRYVITETCSLADNIVLPMDSTERTIDVFVVDASENDGTAADDKKLRIENIVLYTEVIDSNTESDIETAAGTKAAAFNNLYETHDLTLSKTVTGNQGSKDKYFAFEVEITDAGSGTKLDVALDSADAVLDKSAKINESIAADENPDVLTTDASGSVTQTFYLMHGQSLVVKGLPDGAKYTITEDFAEYAVSAEVFGDTDAAADTGIADNGMVSDSTTGIKDDTEVAYTNNKEGTIPTGVILSIAAPCVIGIAVVGGIIVLSVKKKRSEAEE